MSGLTVLVSRPSGLRSTAAPGLSAIALVWLVASPALLTSSLGCTSTVRVQVDAESDLAGLRSWNWLPRSADDDDSSELEPELRELVARTLADRGFRRVHGPADFHVTGTLYIRRDRVTTWETGAARQLSSLHSSPSFAVQSSQPRLVTVESRRLIVSAVDRRLGKVVWRGEIHQRLEDDEITGLGDAVARVLVSFPNASSRGPAPPGPVPTPSPDLPGTRTLAKDLPADSAL